MFLLFDLLQRIKFKLSLDRKNYLLKYAKSRSISSILEIGVFNGNFAERLLKSITLNAPESKIRYLGVDLFAEGFTEEIHVSEVSLHPKSVASIQKKLSKFKNATVKLIPGDSVYVLPKIQNYETFDIVHIDGGHSYNTVLQDWLNVSNLMDINTAVFFDDYANSRGSSLGGFGVNMVVDQIDTKKYDVELSTNCDFFWKDYGLLILRMAKVTLKSKI